MANADRRVELAEEHVRLENDHDFAACIAKFGRARYEVVAGDETFDGEAAGRPRRRARRLLQTLYNTPEKKAARPWAPALNWAVIASLYGLTLLAVYHRQILYADVPAGLGADLRAAAAGRSASSWA